MITRRHRHREFGRRREEIPYGARIFAWSRAVRWIGWGFGEALLPVFILGFSNTFAEAGLFSAILNIASLVSLPIIGLWADRVPARRLVLLSLLLYPLVGVSFFLAGVFGMAIFIVIARLINGFTWELENVGIETYYRRVVNFRRIGESFGFIETWSHIAWIAAALIGLTVVTVVPVHYLLFMVAPFSIIAYIIASHAPKDAVNGGHSAAVDGKHGFSLLRSYGAAFREFRTWNTHLWLLGVLVFFSSVIQALVFLYIPIDAYMEGANLPMVALVAIFGSIPATFGYQIGKFADKRNKFALIVGGIAASAVVSVGLVLFSTYWFKLAAMFLMGIILELFYVVQSSLVTVLGPADRYGERGSALESLNVTSDIVAPLLIGVMLDSMGFSGVSLSLAVFAVVLTIVYGKMAFSTKGA